MQYGELRLAYRSRGGGPTALLLHGSAGSGALWRSLGRKLEHRLRVVAPDLIGYGYSSAWPGGRPFCLDDEKAPLERLVCEQQVHLIGYSYGGAVALRMALANPARLASLTLIEPGPFRLLDEAGERAAFEEVAWMSRAFLRRMEQGDVGGAMHRFVDYWSGRGSWAALEDEARPQLLAAAPKVALDMQASFGARFDPGAIARLRLPTLLVFGERSPLPARLLTAVLAELMAGSRLTCIEGAGHLLPQTHCAQVNESVMRHLLAPARA